MSKPRYTSVPQEGSFSPVSLRFENKMWNWENIDIIIVAVQPGHQKDAQRSLMVQIPFTDGTDRIMSGQIISGTNEEIWHYLQSPDFGPKLMTALDDFDGSLHTHD